MIAIIYYIIGVIIIMESLMFNFCGGFISKKTINKYMNLNEDEFHLSVLDSKHYITNTPFSIFSKYYINEIGFVFRWSKLHKRIDNYFINHNKL